VTSSPLSEFAVGSAAINTLIFVGPVLHICHVCARQT